MNVLTYLKLFLMSFPVLIVLDGFWIGFLMKETYQQKIGYLMNITSAGIQVNWPAALAVWAFIILGSLLFVVPHIKEYSLISGFIWGATYGLVLYGVYDFTNYALIAHWPLSITLIDLAWGSLLNGLIGMYITWLLWLGIN